MVGVWAASGEVSFSLKELHDVSCAGVEPVREDWRCPHLRHLSH